MAGSLWGFVFLTGLNGLGLLFEGLQGCDFVLDSEGPVIGDLDQDVFPLGPGFGAWSDGLVYHVDRIFLFFAISTLPIFPARWEFPPGLLPKAILPASFRCFADYLFWFWHFFLPSVVTGFPLFRFACSWCGFLRPAGWRSLNRLEVSSFFQVRGVIFPPRLFLQLGRSSPGDGDVIVFRAHRTFEEIKAIVN